MKSVHYSHSLCCSSCTFVSLMGFSTLVPLLVSSTVTSFPVQAHLSTNQHSDSTHPHKPLLYDCNTSLHTCERERERETPQSSWTTPPVSIHAEAPHPPVSRVTFSTSVETRHEPACFIALTITAVLSPSSPP